MKIISNWKIYTFVALACAFISFTFNIYTERYNITSPEDQEKVLRGKMLYQQKNCQSCHQLYGLGGYLGPDLTNVITAPNKGEIYAKAIMITAPNSMPKFDLSEEEYQDLFAFLKSVGNSGESDPRKFKIRFNGMIEK